MQIVVVVVRPLSVPLVLVVPLVVPTSILVIVLGSLVGLAPGVGGETDGAVGQSLGAANYGVDAEGAEFIRERLRDF